MVDYKKWRKIEYRNEAYGWSDSRLIIVYTPFYEGGNFWVGQPKIFPKNWLEFTAYVETQGCKNFQNL